MLDTPDENMIPHPDFKNMDSKEILNIIKKPG
jgi:hypothetical protein